MKVRSPSVSTSSRSNRRPPELAVDICMQIFNDQSPIEVEEDQVGIRLSGAVSQVTDLRNRCPSLNELVGNTSKGGVAGETAEGDLLLFGVLVGGHLPRGEVAVDVGIQTVYNTNTMMKKMLGSNLVRMSFALAIALTSSVYSKAPTSSPNQTSWINTSLAQKGAPLCFPRGWPRGAPIPAVGCYQPGWGGSWTNPNVACLAPIINGRRVPPCSGRWV